MRIFLRTSSVASSSPTLRFTPFSSTSSLHGSRSNGVHSSFFQRTQFFSRSRMTCTVSANARPLGAVCRSSSVARVIVSCTHCASAASSVKSICSERLRGVDHVALAVFVNVSKWCRRMSSWNRNWRLKCVSAICGAVSTACVFVSHVTRCAPRDRAALDW